MFWYERRKQYARRAAIRRVFEGVGFAATEVIAAVGVFAVIFCIFPMLLAVA